MKLSALRFRCIEKLKFVSIFVSNLDEFFMVRVGSLLNDLSLADKKATDNKTGMTPTEQLTKISLPPFGRYI